MSRVKLCPDYGKIYFRIIYNTISYLKRNPNIESLVIGISGGVDSALTTVLARKAISLFEDNDRQIKLIGRTLPVETKAEETLRALEIGRLFCDDFLELSLEGIYKKIRTKSTKSEFNDKIRRGNIKARLRMMVLYHLAHLNNGIVLSTDNYTEYLLGFWTLHGDVGDFGMLQNLWKTEVYGIAKYVYEKFRDANFKKEALAIQSCINAIPTDGLGITNSDLDQLGASSYSDVDNILIAHMNGNNSWQDHRVIRRHKRTEFKRNNPESIGREELLK